MAQKPSWKARFHYWFDNTFAGGPLVLIGWLGLATGVLILLATAVVVLLHGVPPSGKVWHVFWNFMSQVLTPDPINPTNPLPYVLVMLVVTLGSLFVASILIGTLTSAIEGKVVELRKGHSNVLESGHTLILGWSPQIVTILSELMIANENQENARLVILADKEKTEMEDELRKRVANIGSTRIICRSGSTVDMTDIEIASPDKAKSIIILPPESDDPDSVVIKTMLALTNDPARSEKPYHIVTQIRDQKNVEVIQTIGRITGHGDRLQAVLTGDLIARVIAQTSRQRGLSTVYIELMNFGGDEIYFTREPSLIGKSYGGALLAYETSAVMGLKKGDGDALLNPPMDTIIEEGDRLFALSADDDTVIVSGLTSVLVDEAAIHPAGNTSAQKPEKCLIIGWNKCAPIILRELCNYVPEGSSALVLADPTVSAEVANVEKVIREECSRFSRQNISFRGGDTTDERLLEEIKPADFDHVIVLSYAGLGIQDADAKTLITLLQMRDIAERDKTPFSIVSEMLDLRNRRLAEVARVDDFIVSDHLISLMMAQLSENPDLHTVFTDILNPEGSEIYIKPVSDYIDLNRPVNFYTLMESARRRSQTAIGYRLISEAGEADKSYGVHTNPNKSELVKYTPEDKLIVIAED